MHRWVACFQNDYKYRWQHWLPLVLWYLYAQSEPRCTPRPRRTTPVIHLLCRCTIRSTPLVQSSQVYSYLHVSPMRCTIGVLLSHSQVYLGVYTLHTHRLPLGEFSWWNFYLPTLPDTCNLLHYGTMYRWSSICHWTSMFDTHFIISLYDTEPYRGGADLSHH